MFKYFFKKIIMLMAVSLAIVPVFCFSLPLSLDGYTLVCHVLGAKSENNPNAQQIYIMSFSAKQYSFVELGRQKEFVGKYQYSVKQNGQAVISFFGPGNKISSKMYMVETQAQHGFYKHVSFGKDGSNRSNSAEYFIRKTDK